MNVIVEEALKIIKNATPFNCKINYHNFNNYKVVTLVISKKDKDVTISINNLDKHQLIIRSSIGGDLSVIIDERDYIMFQSEMLECYYRFRNNIISFCQNFYNE